MRYDEYNHVKIKNDYEGNEFGKTQRREFSSHPGNPDIIGSEMNDTSVINDIREKNAMLGSAAKYEKQKAAEKAQKATEVANASTSATAATSSSAAGVIAGGTAVVGVTAGVFVAVISGAKIQFQPWKVNTNEAYYECELIDVNELDSPYYMYFENEFLEYEEKRELVEGTNSGEFYDLTPDTEYSVKVFNHLETKLIYSETIKTLPELEPMPEPAEVTSFSFDKTANFRTNSFNLSFDYSDPREEMNDFEFKLTLPTGAYRVYSLEKTNEVQTLLGVADGADNISDTPDLDFSDGTTYEYEFAYYIQEERIVHESGTVTFTDNSGAKQEFRGITVSDEADFLDQIIYVTLDMDNDLNHLSNFVFSLMSESFPTCTFNLEPTNRKQAVYIRNAIQGANEWDPEEFTLEDTAFTYSLSYYERDTQKFVSSEEPILFTDISGAVQEFRGVNFDQTANFLTKQFSVTLDMDNDYLHFSNFKLYLLCQEQRTLSWDLEAVTTKQTLRFADATVLMSEGRDPESYLLDYDFTYQVSYMDKDESKSYTGQNTITFVDTSGAKQSFRELIISEEANFLTKEFSVTLDMDNDYGYFEEFTLVLESEGQPTATFSLQAVNTEQTLNIRDAELNISDIEPVVYDMYSFDTDFTFTFSYFNKKTGETITDDGELSFEDNSGAVQEFRSFTLSQNANFLTKQIHVTLDFDNDYGYFNNFTLELMSSEQPKLIFDLGYESGSKTLDVSDAQYQATSGQTMTNFTLHKQFQYTFSYYNSKIGETITQSGTITFTDESGALQEFRGITVNPQADFDQETFKVTLDMDNELDEFHNFTLMLICEDYTIYFALEAVNTEQVVEYQYAYGSNRPSHMDFTQTYDVKVTYNNINTYTVYEAEDRVTFVDYQNRQTVFNGATVADYVDIESMLLGVTLDYTDDYGWLSDFQLTVYVPGYDDNDNLIYDLATYDLTKTTSKQNVDLSTNELVYIEYGMEYQIRISYMHAKEGLQYIDKFITFTEPWNLYGISLCDPQTASFGNSFYLIFNITEYMDKVNFIDSIVLNISCGSSDNPISKQYTLSKRQGYQYVNITSLLDDYIHSSSAVIDSANQYGYPYNLSVNYSVTVNTTDGDSWQEIEPTSTVISNKIESVLVGGELMSTTVNSTSPTLQLKLYGGNLAESYYDFYFVFESVDNPNDSYIVPVEDETVLTQTNYTYSNYQIYLNNCQDLDNLLQMLRTSNVKIELRYSSVEYGAIMSHVLTITEDTKISIN